MPRKYKGGLSNIYDNILQQSEVKGTDGSQYVKFKLKENESIISATGAMIYMNSSVNKAELSFDGITDAAKKLLAGESIVYQKYTGNNLQNGVISLGKNFINSVIVIKIMNGEEYRISRHSFLACTDNIKISFTTQAKGILGIGQEEGFFLPAAACISGEYGYIWLSAYGSFEKLDISAGDYYIVDNGMFLACHNSIQYSLEKIGKTYFSSFLGGEGFGMKFAGPCSIYIQTKNFNEFIQQLSSRLPNNRDENPYQNVANNLIDNMFGKGIKNKKRYKNKSQQ
jgi:uncharacterized protein (TIGR00266 family)